MMWANIHFSQWTLFCKAPQVKQVVFGCFGNLVLPSIAQIWAKTGWIMRRKQRFVWISVVPGTINGAIYGFRQMKPRWASQNQIGMWTTFLWTRTHIPGGSKKMLTEAVYVCGWFREEDECTSNCTCICYKTDCRCICRLVPKHFFSRSKRSFQKNNESMDPLLLNLLVEVKIPFHMWRRGS